ncbi:MAG: serpin family protein [Verrucomicrobiota bacterium]
MSTILPLHLAVVTLLMGAQISRPAEIMAASDTPALVAGNTAFALDLYARLKTADGNLFFSPYSISTCLALAYAGARGDTARQMARVFHFGASQDQLAASFGELQRQLNEAQQKKGLELGLANGLWAEQQRAFLPAFLEAAGGTYQANLQQVDFRTRADLTRLEINYWVSDKTRGKITNLIPPGVLQPTTRLVLVNAIYFKGQWARQFEKTAAIKLPFWITATQEVRTPLMRLTADIGRSAPEFRYAAPEGLQVLELPYAGGALAMVVLLPRERDGLKRMEASLQEPALNDWLAQARQQKVEVFLPSFRLTARLNLAPTLAEMGMTDPFSPRADFSGIDGARDLLISAVIHQAFADVNEEGTEAAAATGTVIRPTIAVMPRPTPVFRADHPFIFLIRDTRSGSLLFLGRVSDPTRASL